MNNNNLFQFVQQGFHVAVGAATDLCETFADPQKRTETLSSLQTELGEKTGEWARKGQVTEQEARRTLETFLNQRGWRQTATTSQPSTETVSNPTSTDNKVQSELQELTEQIIALRNELEELRKSEEPN
jgi:polyhydroxyalkanoate synthesis regulator phasin